METITDYQKQANDFLKKHGIKFSGKYIDHAKHFEDDKDYRDIWLLTLRRNGKQVSFRFGQSINNTGEMPTSYDLLACLTKCDPESFEWFCSNYGYDTDSRKAKRTYKEVMKEWEKVNSFFTSTELEELQEIS